QLGQPGILEPLQLVEAQRHSTIRDTPIAVSATVPSCVKKRTTAASYSASPGESSHQSETADAASPSRKAARIARPARRYGAVAAAGTAAEYDRNAETTIPRKTRRSPARPVAAPKTALTTLRSDGTPPSYPRPRKAVRVAPCDLPRTRRSN